MKNFVFISPNFPLTYWKFCRELKNNGMRVLGIGDCPYDELMQDLKDSLHEYYKVSSLENNDEVFKAVAFFTFKYGKIDWLESNNEYWLMRDAWLRTEFNITTGPKLHEMDKIKYKSAMKAYYEKAGLPVARYHLVEGLEDSLEFAHMVGYPVVVKPDNGVGANNTYKLKSDEDVQWFIATKDDNVYIMEEFVNGYVQTFDGIVDSKGNMLFESGNITPHSLMDIVNDNGDSVYYLVKEIPEKVRQAGLATIASFGVKSRFVHLEFFILNEDQEGLGKKGDVLGLEVNMRPAGGFTPEMYNYSQETDVYKIWADMVAFDYNTKNIGNSHYCAFYGRRDGKQYKLDDYEIMMKYGPKMVMWGRIPEALSGAMANQMYVANFDSEEEMMEYYAKAGLPTARYHLVEGLDDALEFAHMVGYPVVVKPDNGVGANNTYKLKSDDDVRWFIDTKDDNIYIMEEFVNGYVQTFDGIVDSKGNMLFESGNITPLSLMDIVNDNGDSVYYLVKEIPEKVRQAGLATVKSFGVKSRFVHLEFFILNEDQEGLGKKGDVLGLEVNMRPAGGFTPEMYNYSQETDVYKIWADMIAFDYNTKNIGNSHYCAFYGRRDGKAYKLDDYEVMMKYGQKMVMWGRIPDALSGAMANQMYVANFDTEEEMMAFYEDLAAQY